MRDADRQRETQGRKKRKKRDKGGARVKRGEKRQKELAVRGVHF